MSTEAKKKKIEKTLGEEKEEEDADTEIGNDSWCGDSDLGESAESEPEEVKPDIDKGAKRIIYLIQKPRMMTKEQKRAYHAFLNRDLIPRHHHERKVTPKEGCLEGLNIVLSGVFDYHNEAEMKEMIMKYGGNWKRSISGKTSILVRGRDAGKRKSEFATEKGIPILSEASFLDLMETRERPKKVKDPPANKRARKGYDPPYHLEK